MYISIKGMIESPMKVEVGGGQDDRPPLDSLGEECEKLGSLLIIQASQHLQR